MARDMEREARALRSTLGDRGLTHLRVTKRGKALTISGPDDPEARLTHVEGRMWRLDLRHHSGRWDKTPFVGDIVEVVDMAESMGRLADYGPPGPWQP